jgi:hypothetical protein
MKMGTSRNRRSNGNQVSLSSPEKISRHGGSRPGAGRKPGSGNKHSFPVEPVASALAKAVAGKPAFLFICAMQALEASLDDVRAPLGLSQEEFIREYGTFISETAKMRRLGTDVYFADAAGKKRQSARSVR